MYLTEGVQGVRQSLRSKQESEAKTHGSCPSRPRIRPTSPRRLAPEPRLLRHPRASHLASTFVRTRTRARSLTWL